MSEEAPSSSSSSGRAPASEPQGPPTGQSSSAFATPFPGGGSVRRSPVQRRPPRGQPPQLDARLEGLETTVHEMRELLREQHREQHETMSALRETIQDQNGVYRDLQAKVYETAAQMEEQQKSFGNFVEIHKELDARVEANRASQEEQFARLYEDIDALRGALHEQRADHRGDRRGRDRDRARRDERDARDEARPWSLADDKGARSLLQDQRFREGDDPKKLSNHLASNCSNLSIALAEFFIYKRSTWLSFVMGSSEGDRLSYDYLVAIERNNDSATRGNDPTRGCFGATHAVNDRIFKLGHYYHEAFLQWQHDLLEELADPDDPVSLKYRRLDAMQPGHPQYREADAYDWRTLSIAVDNFSCQYLLIYMKQRDPKRGIGDVHQLQCYHEVAKLRTEALGPGKFAYMLHIIDTHLSKTDNAVAEALVALDIQTSFRIDQMHLVHYINFQDDIARRISQVTSDERHLLTETARLERVRRILVSIFNDSVAHDPLTYDPATVALAQWAKALRDTTNNEASYRATRRLFDPELGSYANVKQKIIAICHHNGSSPELIERPRVLTVLDRLSKERDRNRRSSRDSRDRSSRAGDGGAALLHDASDSTVPDEDDPEMLLNDSSGNESESNSETAENPAILASMSHEQQAKMRQRRFSRRGKAQAGRQLSSPSVWQSDQVVDVKRGPHARSRTDKQSSNAMKEQDRMPSHIRQNLAHPHVRNGRSNRHNGRDGSQSNSRQQTDRRGDTKGLKCPTAAVQRKMQVIRNMIARAQQTADLPALKTLCRRIVEVTNEVYNAEHVVDPASEAHKLLMHIADDSAQDVNNLDPEVLAIYFHTEQQPARGDNGATDGNCDWLAADTDDALNDVFQSFC